MICGTLRILRPPLGPMTLIGRARRGGPRHCSRESKSPDPPRAEAETPARRGKWGQAGGTTGRQSGAAPVRVGSPAASNTDSWSAANR